MGEYLHSLNKPFYCKKAGNTQKIHVIPEIPLLCSQLHNMQEFMSKSLTHCISKCSLGIQTLV